MFTDGGGGQGGTGGDPAAGGSGGGGPVPSYTYEQAEEIAQARAQKAEADALKGYFQYASSYYKAPKASGKKTSAKKGGK